MLDDCLSTVDSGGNDNGTVELWKGLFSFSKSTCDYLSSEEDDVFVASCFEREKMRRSAQQSANCDKTSNLLPINHPTNLLINQLAALATTSSVRSS